MVQHDQKQHRCGTTLVAFVSPALAAMIPTPDDASPAWLSIWRLGILAGCPLSNSCDYFLHVFRTAPNNACERDLRPAVIQRKVTNGYRAMWAAEGEADIRTVVGTAQLKPGASVFSTILQTIAA